MNPACSEPCSDGEEKPLLTCECFNEYFALYCYFSGFAFLPMQILSKDNFDYSECHLKM